MHVRRKTATLTLACLCAVFSGCLDNTAKAPATPSDCVRDMSRYSGEGLINAYLDCFSGALRNKLEQSCEQAGRDAFAATLRKRAEPVRGLAISEEEKINENSVRLRVEWVFEDRNEVQIMTLDQINGVWKISAMDGAQYKKPEIPYGTEVF